MAIHTLAYSSTIDEKDIRRVLGGVHLSGNITAVTHRDGDTYFNLETTDSKDVVMLLIENEPEFSYEGIEV